jgi:hypothetical protein
MQAKLLEVSFAPAPESERELVLRSVQFHSMFRSLHSNARTPNPTCTVTEAQRDPKSRVAENAEYYIAIKVEDGEKKYTIRSDKSKAQGGPVWHQNLGRSVLLFRPFALVNWLRQTGPETHVHHHLPAANDRIIESTETSRHNTNVCPRGTHRDARGYRRSFVKWVISYRGFPPQSNGDVLSAQPAPA